MTTCNRDVAQRFLDDSLSEPELTLYVRHLDDCTQCRGWLEDDAGAAGDWRETRDLLGASSELALFPPRITPESQFSQSECEMDGQRAGRSVDLSFLAPSDDPAYAGKLGGYLVSGLIGRGGMGIVLKAVDSSLNRQVAIKVLDPALSDLGAARQRFAREARAMAAISHEHVIPIYAVDEQRGIPFFAMEYVAGGTLEARLRRQGTLNVISIVRIALQTARALGAAHDSGLVHRDIKPGNILLDQGTERVRVADFGLARVSNDVSFTRSGIVAGTPQFMSPEQVRGETCDARSDLFSLGSMMYAMCTGHAPFRAETLYGAMHRIVHETPRPIREQNAEIPEWLAAFIDRLLQKDRDRRFSSAAQVAEALELELAAIQNPATAAPARPWMESTQVKLQSISRRQLLWLGACAGTGVIALCTWLTLSGAGHHSTGPNSPEAIVKERTAPALSEMAAGSPPPLWGVDGFDAAQARANQMEQELLLTEPSPQFAAPQVSPDVRELQIRLRELEQEF